MNNAAVSLLQMSQMISRHKTGSRLIFEAFKKAAQADYCDPGGGGGATGVKDNHVETSHSQDKQVLF